MDIRNRYYVAVYIIVKPVQVSSAIGGCVLENFSRQTAQLGQEVASEKRKLYWSSLCDNDVKMSSVGLVAMG